MLRIPVCITSRVCACCEPTYVGTSHYLNNVLFNINVWHKHVKMKHGAASRDKCLIGKYLAVVVMVLVVATLSMLMSVTANKTLMHNRC